MTKQHIINEIQRTAHTNGGTALGRERFERETGIRESDWSGRYWVRWSEAVKEAGFEPNRLTVAHEDVFLIEKYIALIRELGRIPVQGELVMKRRNDAEFPSDKVFRRFGSKSQLMERVGAYCKEKAGYEDVVSFLPNGEIEVVDVEDDDDENEPEFGFVYLIKSGRHFKIGRSNAAGRREREIALQLPEKATTIHIIRTDDPPGIEAYWHRRFADKRKNGEWFELSAVDVKACKRRKFM